MNDAKGFVVHPDDGQLLSMAPGRSSLLKLLSEETGGSVMLFVETAPPGTETTMHLHKGSDEVAYVLKGEITFKIGDEVTTGGPGSCAFLPKGVAHAWKNTGGETGQVLFLYTPAGAGKFFEEQIERPLSGPANGPEAIALRERHGWEVVGPPPF
jgi:quercetin dioxygenase-like cupin family protein